MTKKYRVLFHGLKGDKEAFKARMVHFRAPAETVDRMISAAPIILKGDLTLGDARRYADAVQDAGGKVRALIRVVGRIVGEEGYRLHKRKKMSIRRRHQQQRVTGLVVNERINLPRDTRRRLRAIEHRLAAGRKATLTEEQVRGWRALLAMVRRQAGPQEVS